MSIKKPRVKAWLHEGKFKFLKVCRIALIRSWSLGESSSNRNVSLSVNPRI